jgi:hypothetical protein
MVHKTIDLSKARYGGVRCSHAEYMLSAVSTLLVLLRLELWVEANESGKSTAHGARSSREGVEWSQCCSWTW